MAASDLIETKMFTPFRVKKRIESSFICSTIFGEIFKTFLLVIGISWSISMITMGYHHRDNCPYGSHSIPKTLTLFGASTLVLLTSFILYAFDRYIFMKISRIENRESWRYFFYFYLDFISVVILIPCVFVSLFSEIIFLLYGSSLVYFTAEKNVTFALTFTNTSSKGYCDETFFKFSFWSFSSAYISLGLLILVGLVSFSCSEFENNVKAKQPKDTNKVTKRKIEENKC